MIPNNHNNMKVYDVNPLSDGNCLYHAEMDGMIYAVLTDRIKESDETCLAIKEKLLPKIAQKLGVRDFFKGDTSLKHSFLKLLQAFTVDPSQKIVLDGNKIDDNTICHVIQNTDLEALFSQVTASALREVMYEYAVSNEGMNNEHFCKFVEYRLQEEITPDEKQDENEDENEEAIWNPNRHTNYFNRHKEKAGNERSYVWGEEPQHYALQNALKLQVQIYVGTQKKLLEEVQAANENMFCICCMNKNHFHAQLLADTEAENKIAHALREANQKRYQRICHSKPSVAIQPSGKVGWAFTELQAREKFVQEIKSHLGLSDVEVAYTNKEQPTLILVRGEPLISVSDEGIHAIADNTPQETAKLMVKTFLLLHKKGTKMKISGEDEVLCQAIREEAMEQGIPLFEPSQQTEKDLTKIPTPIEDMLEGDAEFGRTASMAY